MLSLTKISRLLLLLSSAHALTHDVDVGKNGLVFDHEVVLASVGDLINFHFYPVNHSVAQSTYDKPCQPLSGGIDQTPMFSGFIPTEGGIAYDMFSMKVKNTDPMWLYCSQTYHDHCKAGQVMVVNPVANSDQTLEQYKQASMMQEDTISPDKVFGGVVVAEVASTETGSTTSSTPMSTSSTSDAASASSINLASSSGAPRPLAALGFAMLFGALA